MTRGIYASILSTQLGKFVLPVLANRILGSPINEAAFVDYVVKNNFTSVTLYDLNHILGIPDLEKKLAKFIFNLRMNGVVEINGAVAAEFQVLSMKQFNSKYPAKFDGIITEMEFWNGSNQANDLIDLALVLFKANVLGFNTAAYIGYMDRIATIAQDRIAALLVKLCDKILVHAYVKDPAQAVGYIQSRVTALKLINPNVEIWPIFSVEGPGTATGDEIFMGDFWKKNPSFQNVENLVPGYLGYQWFEYGILRAYS